MFLATKAVTCIELEGATAKLSNLTTKRRKGEGEVDKNEQSQKRKIPMAPHPQGRSL